jgi:hypothetical protein
MAAMVEPGAGAAKRTSAAGLIRIGWEALPPFYSCALGPED